MLVLVRAVVLAQNSGASEIGIDHLLAALDPETSSAEPVAPPEGPFFPVPRQDMALAPDAAAASLVLLKVLRNDEQFEGIQSRGGARRRAAKTAPRRPAEDHDRLEKL